jgi:hypothetical protein
VSANIFDQLAVDIEKASIGGGQSPRVGDRVVCQMERGTIDVAETVS